MLRAVIKSFVSPFRLADRLREQPVEHYPAPPTPRTAPLTGAPSHCPPPLSRDPKEAAEPDKVLSSISSRSSPTHCPKTEPERGRGTTDKGQGAVHQQQPPVVTPSHAEVALSIMEAQRPPSPQFSPQRLSDKPPVSLHEDSNSNR